jgi:hypothetical protein
MAVGVAVCAAGIIFIAHFETTPVGSTLVVFEWMAAQLGVHIGFSLEKQLKPYVSAMVPGFRWKHLVTALGLNFLILASIVLGVFLSGTGPVWTDAPFLKMFSLAWGWSLLWISLGHYLGMLAFFPALMHLSVMPAAPTVIEPLLWSLIREPGLPAGIVLLADGVLCALVCLQVLRRPGASAGRNAFAKMRRERIPYNLHDLPNQSLSSRVRHLKLSLKPEYWGTSMLIVTAALLWSAYRRYNGNLGPFETVFGPIYVACFLVCFFMLPRALDRDQLRSVFRLPFRRQDIVRDYGMMLLTTCAQRWFWFVLAASAAFLIPLPGVETIPPTVEVWIYCAGILFVTLGARALFASWPDNSLVSLGAVAIPVLYGSFSDVIPMTPALSVFIGIGIVAASYFRWCNVEVD